VGIGFERQVVSALRCRADPVIDTFLLTAADLMRSLIGYVAFVAVVCVLPRPLPIVGAARAIPTWSLMRAFSTTGVTFASFARRPGWQPVP